MINYKKKYLKYKQKYLINQIGGALETLTPKVYEEYLKDFKNGDPNKNGYITTAEFRVLTTKQLDREFEEAEFDEYMTDFKSKLGNVDDVNYTDQEIINNLITLEQLLANTKTKTDVLFFDNYLDVLYSEGWQKELYNLENDFFEKLNSYHEDNELKKKDDGAIIYFKDDRSGKIIKQRRYKKFTNDKLIDVITKETIEFSITDSYEKDRVSIIDSVAFDLFKKRVDSYVNKDRKYDVYLNYNYIDKFLIIKFKKVFEEIFSNFGFYEKYIKPIISDVDSVTKVVLDYDISPVKIEVNDDKQEAISNIFSEISKIVFKIKEFFNFVKNFINNKESNDDLNKSFNKDIKLAIFITDIIEIIVNWGVEKKNINFSIMNGVIFIYHTCHSINDALSNYRLNEESLKEILNILKKNLEAINSNFSGTSNKVYKDYIFGIYVIIATINYITFKVAVAFIICSINKDTKDDDLPDDYNVVNVALTSEKQKEEKLKKELLKKDGQQTVITVSKLNPKITTENLFELTASGKLEENKIIHFSEDIYASKNGTDTYEIAFEKDHEYVVNSVTDEGNNIYKVQLSKKGQARMGPYFVLVKVKPNSQLFVKNKKDLRVEVKLVRDTKRNTYKNVKLSFEKDNFLLYFEDDQVEFSAHDKWTMTSAKNIFVYDDKLKFEQGKEYQLIKKKSGKFQFIKSKKGTPQQEIISSVREITSDGQHKYELYSYDEVKVNDNVKITVNSIPQQSAAAVAQNGSTFDKVDVSNKQNQDDIKVTQQKLEEELLKKLKDVKVETFIPILYDLCYYICFKSDNTSVEETLKQYGIKKIPPKSFISNLLGCKDNETIYLFITDK